MHCGFLGVPGNIMNNGPPDLQVNGKLDEPVALQEIGSLYKESNINTCIHTSYLCYFICESVFLHRCKTQNGAKQPFGLSQPRGGSARQINNPIPWAYLVFLHRLAPSTGKCLYEADRCKKTKTVQKNQTPGRLVKPASPEIK